MSVDVTNAADCPNRFSKFIWDMSISLSLSIPTSAVPSGSPSLACFRFLRPKHGQQSHVTIFGLLGPLGGL
uniref:CesA12 n=1 Tax=Arundo donax TaxID=35708 RepID=A0A0A9GGS4_ARUDO